MSRKKSTFLLGTLNVSTKNQRKLLDKSRNYLAAIIWNTILRDLWSVLVSSIWLTMAFLQCISSTIQNTKNIVWVYSPQLYKFSTFDGCDLVSLSLDTIIWDSTFLIAKKWTTKVQFYLFSRLYTLRAHVSCNLPVRLVDIIGQINGGKDS